jgi:hypothetical protein
MESSAQMVSSVLGGFSQLGGKFKVFAIAQAIISTYLAAAKTWAQWGFPIGIPMVASQIAAGMANVAKIKSQSSHRFGTMGLDYKDFGSGQTATLHGKEAVIPQSKAGHLADDIAVSLAGAAPGAAIASAASTPDISSEDTGDMDSSGAVVIPISIDGKEVARAVIPDLEKFSKAGKFRTHTQGVRTF